MNDLTCTDAAYYKGSSYALVDFLTLINKVRADEGLIRNIAPTVNRTWVHANHVGKATQALDTNQCEHLADKFWLLGCGHVNCTGINSSGTLIYNDANYDTSCFSGIFTPRDGYNVANASRIKYVMTTTGSVGGSAGCWWLRSAYSSNDGSVGDVFTAGSVSSYIAYSDYGCSPAFQIG